MTHKREDQRPTREEDGQHEHAQQRPDASKPSPAVGGASSSVTQSSKDSDASTKGTASPSPEPVPDVRRGALNTVAARKKQTGTSEQSEEAPEASTKRGSVESAIDPDATSPQGGSSTDTMTPGGRGR